MCGRYYLADLSEDDVKDMKQILRDIDKMSLNSDLKLKTEGEIFPTDIVPVVSNNKQKEIKAFPMEWGYKPFSWGFGGNIFIFKNCKDNTTFNSKNMVKC